jgi:anaerobic magnesium-protoporphyrin IX monomethyl ester cyclase
MKPVEVLLVAPGNHDGSLLYQGLFQESLALGFLAAAPREKGFDAQILDRHIEDIPLEQFAPRVAGQAEGKLIGFTGMIGRHLLDKDHILRFLGENSVRPLHVVAGGVLPSLSPATVLTDYRDVDSVLLYEGELSIVALATALQEGGALDGIPGRAYRKENGDIVCNLPSPYIKDLDALPFPSRDTLAYVLERRGPALIQSSRGCHGSCTFCIQHYLNRILTGGIWRGRNPKHIVREIADLLQRFPIYRFKFVDENFFMYGAEGQRRAVELSRHMKSEGIRIPFLLSARVDDIEEATLLELMEVGLYRMHIGIEAGADRVLARHNKRITLEDNIRVLKLLKKLGLDLQIGFIMFDPESTLAELREALTFLREQVLGLYITFGGITYRLRNSVRIYPGSPLHEHYAKAGILKRANKDPYLFIHRFRDPRVDIFWPLITRNLEPVQNAFRKLELYYQRKRINLALVMETFLKLDERAIDWSLSILNHIERHNISKISETDDFIESLRSEIYCFCGELVNDTIAAPLTLNNDTHQES